jgi:signal transduction histidine kinase/ActR/RegA family two-component response regulator
MKKYNRQKLSSIVIWSGLALLIILLVFFSVYFYRTMRVQMFYERQDHLSEMTIKISEILNLEINNLQTTSDSACEIIDWNPIESQAELFDTLRDTKIALGLDSGLLIGIDDNGIFYTSSGIRARWSTPEDLETTDRTPLIREMIIGGQKDTYMVFMRKLESTDLLADRDAELTHTALVIPLTDMKDMLSISGFGGECFTYLINQSGRRLYKQTFDNTFIEEFNVLSALKDYRFTIEGSREELAEAIRNQQDLCLEFEIPDTGEKYFVSTVPIGDTDWAVLVFVPTNVLGSSSNIVMSNLMMYLAFIAILVVAILSLLIFITLRRSTERHMLHVQERNNQILEQAAEEANRANQAKSEFLSHMSHDIRTPINGIVGMVNIALKNNNDTERVHECLTKISGAADHLLSLINDVLEMSRIESGRVDMAQKPLNICTLVDNCNSIIDGQLITRKLTLSVEMQELQHPAVLGDELRLRQIFINILGNAVKFTPDGGRIIFRVEEIETDETKVRYRFEFEDNGIGMSEEFQEHIFEAFSQEDGGSRTNYNGTGLGMSITQQFVEMMGGTITVRSKLSEGSCFTVEIPFTYIEEEKKEEKQQVNKSLKGLRVLLVEDNELNMEIAVEILEDEEVVVTTAEDGQRALEVFEESPPNSFDMILMDIMMPRMNGYEATRAIRACGHPDSGTIPIIAMSANAYAEDVAEALSSGMNAHVAKPIDVHLLFDVMYQYCSETGDDSGGTE